MEKANEQFGLEGVRGAFRYYISEEDGDTLRYVHIYCECGYDIEVDEMQGQDVIECPGCDSRYTGTYKGWLIMKLRKGGSEADEQNGKSLNPDG